MLQINSLYLSMNKIDFYKLTSFLKIKEKVQPLTFLDELAANGLLDDYMQNIFKEKSQLDDDFRDRIFDSYLKYSPDRNENLERYYLESICESLSYFIEYTKRCKKQRQ